MVSGEAASTIVQVVASLFLSRAILAFIAAATTEACCIGTAVYVLTTFPRAVMAGSAGATLLAFFALTAGRFLWRGLAEFALAETQATAINRLISKATERHTSRPDIRGEAQEKDRFVAGLPGTGVDIVTGLTHFLDRTCRVTLTMGFMLILYSELLGEIALLANLLGLAATVVGSIALRTRQKQVSTRYETRRMQLAALPAAGWDTITIANELNLERWRSVLRRTFRNFVRAQRGLTWTTVSSQWLVVLTGHIPSFLVLWFILHSTPPTRAMELIVAPPGFLVLLGSQAELSAICANAGVLSAQAKILEGFLVQPLTVNVLHRVDFSRIYFTLGERIFCADNIEDLLEKLPQAGTVTMTGDNGSGKSSLFLYLKSEFGTRAFYLPANHSLLAHKTLDMSTGESVVDQVSAAVSDTHVSVLLMDEWRANLDRANSLNVGSLLTEAAANGRLVIESLPSRA